MRSAAARGFLSRRTTRDAEGRSRTSVRITPLGGSIFAAGLTIVVTPDTDLDDLPHPDLIAAVARDGSTAPQAEALARRLGRDVDQLWLDLGECERSGAVQLRPDHPDGPAVALSPWLADRLGLVLASDGSRWVRPGQLDPTDWAGLSRPVWASIDDEDLGIDQADPDAIDGLMSALLGESAVMGLVIRERDLADIDAREAQHEAEMKATNQARQSRNRAERKALEAETRRLPAKERKRLLADLEARQHSERMRGMMDRITDARPTPSVRPLPVARLLIGMRPPWPLLIEEGADRYPWTPANGPCPACGGSGPLSLLAVCLVCHRSGLDGLLAPVEPSMIPRAERFAATGKSGLGRPRKADGPLKGRLGVT